MITIIVLLILAGITIATLTGNNGIITQTENAKDSTRGGEIKERVDLAIVENELAENTDSAKKTRTDIINELVADGKLTQEEVEKLENEDVITIGSITIDFSGLEKPQAAIPTTESYVGYYADLDPTDGKIDGIIYADLAVKKSGRWNNDNWSDYSYSAETDLKSYYISGEGVEGGFGDVVANVISPISGTTGNDRFYIMALEDFAQDSQKYFYWYYNAYGKLKREVDTSYNDFGQGKKNTIDMINDWNNNTATYGAQTTAESGKSYIDMWGAIQDGQYNLVQNETDSGKWFIPSKAEWAAFGDFLYTNLGVTTSNYGNYGLSNYYWSSSQKGTGRAYFAGFGYGCINDFGVNGIAMCVWARLSNL